jgi:hypothetical protein
VRGSRKRSLVPATMHRIRTIHREHPVSIALWTAPRGVPFNSTGRPLDSDGFLAEGRRVTGTTRAEIVALPFPGHDCWMDEVAT